MLQYILPMQYTVYFNIVAVYLQYILQTSWSVHSVYTATILPYTVSLLCFGQGVSCRGSEVWRFDGDPAPLARDNIFTGQITRKINKYKLNDGTFSVENSMQYQN